MTELVKVLMNRDGVSRQEAEEMVKECAEDLQMLIENDDIVGASEIMMTTFGLETDYLFDLGVI